MADGIITPCNVACGSGIVTVNSPSGSTLQCDTWLWMTCHWIRPSVRHIGILHLVSISTISSQSTLHSAPVCEILSNRTTLGRKKWRHVDFQDGGSLPSCILGSLNGFFEKPKYTTSYRSSIETIALNCLVKIAFFAFWRQTDRQTDKQTNRWTAPMH